MIASRAVLMAMLLFSGAVIWSTFGQTPAFNPRLVSETVTGDRRTPLIRAMFDRGEYEFQRGYGYLIADTFVPENTPLSGGDASQVAVKRPVEMAGEALEAAVHLDPGNAHAWVALAWARARLGDRSGSLEALRVSSEIAPFSRSLADRRIKLAGVLLDPRGQTSPPSDDVIVAITRDMDELRRFNPRALDRHLEASPPLAVFDAVPPSN